MLRCALLCSALLGTSSVGVWVCARVRVSVCVGGGARASASHRTHSCEHTAQQHSARAPGVGAVCVLGSWSACDWTAFGPGGATVCDGIALTHPAPGDDRRRHDGRDDRVRGRRGHVEPRGAPSSHAHGRIRPSTPHDTAMYVARRHAARMSSMSSMSSSKLLHLPSQCVVPRDVALIASDCGQCAPLGTKWPESSRTVETIIR